jgi:rsbT co-antagonist protein RsbR
MSAQPESSTSADETIASLQHRIRELERAQLNQIFALSLDMMCVADDQGRFVQLNGVWEQTLGHTLDELRAAPFISFVHPDDVPETIATYGRLLGGQNVISFKNRYRCKDGSYRWLDWTCTYVAESKLVYAMARDISERKRAEDERLAVEARLRHLVSFCSVAIYSRATTDDRAVTYISESITSLLGYAPEEIAKDGWDDKVHGDDAQLIQLAHLALAQSGQFSTEYRVRDKHGEYRWLHDAARLVRDGAGSAIEIVGSLQDVTDRRRAEQTVREQAASLMELSTPLIPISDRIVVMPLVGTMDSQRAEQVLVTLVRGVVDRQARAAILDITGVSVVDSQVADALVRAAKAVKLVGAQVVLTGIRPDVAQTLVELGVDLSSIVTSGTLQAGIAYAMRSASASGG